MNVQSALYNGHEIVKTNHTPAVVHHLEDTLELAEITRKRIHENVKSPLCVQKRVKIAPPYYSKENYLAIFIPQRHLTPETDILVLRYLSVDPETNFKNDGRITPCGLTEGERGFEQIKECYLTEVIPFFKTLKKHFEGIQTALVKEVKEMKEIFEQMEAEVEQNDVDKQCADIERKNLLIENQNLIADFFEKNIMKESLQGKDNTIRKLKVEISQMNERRSKADRILDFKTLDFQNTELTEKVNITRAKTIEKITSMLTEIENLKAQLKGKMKCVTMDTVKLIVLTPGMYAIDVEPIPPYNRNNREVHLDYLKHLKESIETLHEIVEEARIEIPLDNTLENWKPTGRKLSLGEHCLLTRFTISKVVHLHHPEHVSSSEIVITEKFSNTSQKPLTIYKCKNKQEKAISNDITTTAESQSIGDSV
ncbi:hypothetical protein Tco_0773019 [Tanacetum coccineum]|uniref:Uncharacterized protein n=1 Tax=Tanacetum coccineum TaxID=301880 RepID=A0ABQ4ZNL5_9ASTR